jgi:hypothetical protein
MLLMTRFGVASVNVSVADGGSGRVDTAGVGSSRAGRTAVFEDRNRQGPSRADAMREGTTMTVLARSWAGRTDGRRAKQHSVKTDVVAVALDPWPLRLPFPP